MSTKRTRKNPGKGAKTIGVSLTPEEKATIEKRIAQLAEGAYLRGGTSEYLNRLVGIDLKLNIVPRQSTLEELLEKHDRAKAEDSTPLQPGPSSSVREQAVGSLSDAQKLVRAAEKKTGVETPNAPVKKHRRDAEQRRTPPRGPSTPGPS